MTGTTPSHGTGHQHPVTRPPAPEAQLSPVMLERIVELIFRPTLAFALFLLVAGHNAPGGGFIAGLVVGGAFVLRWLAGRTTPPVLGVRPEPLLGLGLLIAVGTGVVPWLFGGVFLESAKLAVDLPLVGKLVTSSTLIFDIGVFLVVVGLVGAIVDPLVRQVGSRPRGEDGDT